eukprot:CAMPEP_0171257902 /NCGR_PEP_ID=MMETSP0790-20130122/54098_1 /TAXON_ID=2925 /ORGANISM="Alexandrium catenella, Strain OF101" /LENGTH=500 /DNA_ID=CAMNT_0011726053 /DNA_START=1 /DNA_END=1501 /DNA_ORIENTATION=+
MGELVCAIAGSPAEHTRAAVGRSLQDAPASRGRAGPAPLAIPAPPGGFAHAFPYEAAEVGHWVFFSDDDDLWHPARYAEYLAHIEDAEESEQVGLVGADSHAKMVRMVGEHAIRPEDVDQLLKQSRSPCIRTDADRYLHAIGKQTNSEDLPEYWDFALRATWFGHFLRNTTEPVLASKFCDRRLGSLCSLGLRRNGSNPGCVRWFHPKSWLYFYSRCDCFSVVKESRWFPYMGGASASVKVTSSDHDIATRDQEALRASGSDEAWAKRILGLRIEDVALLVAKMRATIEEQVLCTCASVVYAEELKNFEDAVDLLYIAPFNQHAGADKDIRNWALVLSRVIGEDVCKTLGMKVKTCLKSGPVVLSPEEELRTEAAPRVEIDARPARDPAAGPYFLVGSWSYFTKFTELKRIVASEAFSARVPIVSSPGQEEFQIVQDLDWDSCFYCGSNGEVMGPRDGPGTNWIVDVPEGCSQIEVFWKPTGTRSVDGGSGDAGARGQPV